MDGPGRAWCGAICNDLSTQVEGFYPGVLLGPCLVKGLDLDTWAQQSERWV